MTPEERKQVLYAAWDEAREMKYDELSAAFVALLLEASVGLVVYTWRAYVPAARVPVGSVNQALW